MTDLSLRPSSTTVRRKLVLRQLRGVRELLDSAVTIELAAREADLREALRLAHDEYVAAGIMKPTSSGLRVTVHTLLPSTQTFVVRDRGRLAGQVTIVGDSPFGLRLEASHADVVARLRGPASSVAEIVGLACAREYQGTGLVYFLLVVAHSVLLRQGVTTALIRVPPVAAGVYQDVFACRLVGEARAAIDIYQRPYVVLAFDVASAWIETSRAVASVTDAATDMALLKKVEARAQAWRADADSPPRLMALAALTREFPELVVGLSPLQAQHLTRALAPYLRWPAGSDFLPALVLQD